MIDNNLSEIAVKRSSSFKKINKITGFLKKLGFSPFKLDADRIINKSIKKAKWEGKIPDQAEEGLRIAVNAINNEGSPNGFGSFSIKMQFETTLYNRLKIEQHLKKNPHIEKTVIKEPVFIAGMPRTGTTILHAMMHEDPMFRSPLAWETVIPYPVPKPETYEYNKQIEEVNKRFNQLFKIMPDFQKKHYMDSKTPQECVSINLFDFNSFQIPVLFNIPTYMDWFDNKSDHLKTMQFHKKFLQFLESGGVKADHWLLKTPLHLKRLPELFDVYPDARIIVTHRHPFKIVGSISSFISSLRSVYSDTEDSKKTALEQTDLWSKYFDLFLDSLEKLDKNDRIIHVNFNDFVKDQFKTIKHIYKQFNWEMTPEAEKKIAHFIKQNPKDKNGVHQYSLEDFGLTEKYVEKKFKRYIEFIEKI